MHYIGIWQDFSELRQTIDDAFTKLEELEEEGRRNKVIDQIHCSPARFIMVTMVLMVVAVVVVVVVVVVMMMMMVMMVMMMMRGMIIMIIIMLMQVMKMTSTILVKVTVDIIINMILIAIIRANPSYHPIPDPFIISKSRQLNKRVTLNVGGVR